MDKRLDVLYNFPSIGNSLCSDVNKVGYFAWYYVGGGEPSETKEEIGERQTPPGFIFPAFTVSTGVYMCLNFYIVSFNRSPSD